MASRLSLQSKLQALIGSRQDGKSNVYFQPPESVKLNYPCIVYERAKPNVKHANNKAYQFTQCYKVTLIGKNPEWELPEQFIKTFEYSDIDRYFVSDNLYHTAITLYY